LPKEDRALETALDVLDGTVCECGCMDTEHTDDREQALEASDPVCDCGCTRFRPVDFQVRRASVRARA